MSFDESNLTGGESVDTGAQGAGGGGPSPPGECAIDVNSTPGFSGDGSPGAPLNQSAATGSPLTNGYMSGTQALQLSELALLEKWYINRLAEAQALIPGLAVTRWEKMPKLGFEPFGGVASTSLTGNAIQEGGTALLGAATSWFFSQTVFGTPLNGDYFIAYGFAMRVLNGTNKSFLGLLSQDQNTEVDLVVDPTKANFHAQIKGTSGLGTNPQDFDLGVPLDLNPHNFGIGTHGGRTYFIFDGALKATSPNNTNLLNVALAPYAFNAGNGELHPMCGLYAYVDGLPP